MRKFFFGFIMILLFCFAPLYAYAGSLDETVEVSQQEENEIGFTITSGLNADGKRESTFEESRTISGTADEGATVEISVFLKSARGNLNEQATYTIEIGATELFSQTVELSEGDNVIFVTAYKEDCDPIECEGVIRRKSGIIKEELENGISILSSTGEEIRLQ